MFTVPLLNPYVYVGSRLSMQGVYCPCGCTANEYSCYFIRYTCEHWYAGTSRV